MENQTQIPPASQQAPPAQPLTPPSPQNKSPLKWLLIFLVLLILIPLAAYLFVLPKNESKISQVLPTPTIAPSPTPTPNLYREPTGSAATANWETYKNEKLGFEFKYPSSYKLEKEDTEKVTFSGTFQPGNQIIPSELILFLNRKTDLQSLKNCEDVEFKENIITTCIDGDIETKSINGVNMRSFHLVHGSKNIQATFDFVVQTVSKQNIEFVHHVIGGGVKTSMNQILSTLKFLDQKHEAIYCPRDLKLCPDGSSVGRTGLNCEFAPCPGQ